MNILEEIAGKRAIDTENRKKVKSLDQVKAEAIAIADKEKADNNGEFLFRFYNQLKRPGINFICEVKKASPSKGLIAPDFPYVEIAKDYDKAGAAAISVLTEPEYFMGRDEYLTEISKNVSIPIIRKDFTVDAYQIYEAKMIGASAVLLICAILDDDKLKEFIQVAESVGLAALVEAHDEEEVNRALNAGARLIGVNNRNLKDFTVDINNSIRLRKLIPEEITFVSESGIKTAADIQALRDNKTNAVLIGETLMRSENKAEELAKLRGDK